MRFPTLLPCFLLFLFTLAVAQADSKTDAILRLADLNAAALKKNDFATIAKFTYPPLVEKLGGKDKMVALMKQGTADMEAKKVSIVSVQVGTPGAVVTSGDKMYSIVPTTTVMTSPDDKITLNSFLLAISTDSGANWSFLDGSGIDTFNITEIIPDFPQSFKLPFKEPAHMEPIVNSHPGG